MDKPTHVFEDSSSLWAFYNYVTTALQSSHPKTWMEDQRVLHYFISSVNNFSKPLPVEVEVEHEEEEKIEMIFPVHLQEILLSVLKIHHPYETVAFDILQLENGFDQLGAGALGKLPEPVEALAFMQQLKLAFGTGVIRHTPIPNKKIEWVALCGGSGKSLINIALRHNADAYITADLGYHDFFIPHDRMLLADIGHFESEQYTPDLLVELIKEKFPTFAVLKSGTRTSPVNYFL
jgi:putative NIF3 family GTP cyclohydrolase 1 type 2